jgi:hypothetical protein
LEFPSGRREHLHLIGDPVAITVRHRIDFGLAGTDEHHASIGADSHLPGIRNDGIKADLEALRKLDLRERLLDAVGRLAFLRDSFDLERCAC